ncbi:MAG: LuxR C-terminal-related transcriptional regulator [Bacteroidales bacterium]|nr:LuxR C-terminal-related transcriptional regulator [Bacteroidales bacterium]
MPFSVIISEPSYLMKRGLAALIGDILHAEIIFLDDTHELNHYLDMNMVQAVFINEQILNEMQDPELFFQLKADTRYIVLSDTPNIRNKRKFDAVLNRNAQKDDIVPLIEKVLKNEINATGHEEAILSSREQEVLKQVAMGYTNQEIADRLHISKHTVISHRKNLTSKLGIKTVSGLTLYAVLNDLIPKDQIK